MERIDLSSPGVILIGYDTALWYYAADKVLNLKQGTTRENIRLHWNTLDRLLNSLWDG